MSTVWSDMSWHYVAVPCIKESSGTFDGQGACEIRTVAWPMSLESSYLLSRKTRTYARTRSQFVSLFRREKFIAERQNHNVERSASLSMKKSSSLAFASRIRSREQNENATETKPGEKTKTSNRLFKKKNSSKHKPPSTWGEGRFCKRILKGFFHFFCDLAKSFFMERKGILYQSVHTEASENSADVWMIAFRAHLLHYVAHVDLWSVPPYGQL